MGYIWIAIVSLLGSTVQGATGFGYAMICMSLWPLLIPFKMASIMEVISAFVMTIGIAFKFRRHINFKLMIIPFFSSIIGSTLGVSLLMAWDDVHLQKILGIALILLALYFIFYSEKIHIRPTITNSIIFGFISGFSGGLFNVGGPAMVVYYLTASKDKMEYNATLQANFALNIVYTFILHLYYGNVTIEALRYSALSITGLLIGTFIGLKIFDKLPQDQFKKVIYTFIMIMGIFLTVKH